MDAYLASTLNPPRASDVRATVLNRATPHAAAGAFADPRAGSQITQITANQETLNNHIPLPNGRAGEYYDGDEQFGPDFWSEIIAEHLRQMRTPLMTFLSLLASLISEDIEDMFDSNLENNLVTDMSEMAHFVQSQYIGDLGSSPVPELGDLIQKRHQDFKTQYLLRVRSGIIENSKPKTLARSAFPPRSTAPPLTTTTTSDLDKVDAELAKNTRRNAAPFPTKSRAEALLWVLKEIENPGKIDVEIVDRLFPDNKKPVVTWITHHLIGGMAFVRPAIAGAISDAVGTLTRELKRPITYDDAMIKHLHPFANFVAASIKRTAVNRFTTAVILENSQHDYILKMRAVIAAMKGKVVSHRDNVMGSLRDAINT